VRVSENEARTFTNEIAWSRTTTKSQPLSTPAASTIFNAVYLMIGPAQGLAHLILRVSSRNGI